MGEKRFIISDAAKLVDVESHVLRYWEEELGIEIPRNEMGHRYYEECHIALLKNVKELKDCGYQLKAIKMLVPELLDMQKENHGNLDALKAELFNKVARVSMELGAAMESGEPGQAEGRSLEPEAAALADGTSSAARMSGEPEKQGMEVRIPAEPEKTGLQDTLVVTKQPEVIHKNSIGVSTAAPLNGSKLEQFQMILSEVVSNVLKENTGEFGKEVSDMVSDNVIKEMDYYMHIREKQEEERFKKLDETIRNYQMNRKENTKQSWLFGRIKKHKNAGCE